jgi:spore coat polysaccharide biosynthesis predicted glycosyltransferase SpsG
MGIAGAPLPHFLVEWYRPTIAEEPLEDSVARLIRCAASISAAGSPVHLLATLAVPSDEIVLAVFDSAAERTVAEVCRQAGCPAQRVTTAVDARFWRGS